MNFTEKYKDNYQRFTKLPEMRKLWHSNYWDGALSGMCLINGEKCWFDLLEEFNDYPEDDEEYDKFEEPWYRRFLVWKLTPEQNAEIEKRHARFQELVGYHTDYDENGKRDLFNKRDHVTGETTAQYFAEAKLYPKLDITPSEVLLIRYYWKHFHLLR